MPTVVLITGFARSGKDTLAAGIIEGARRSDCAQINFADGLKESANKFLEWVGLLDDETDFFDDDYKARNRNVLVELGRFARSHDKDIFAKMLCADADEFSRSKRREETLKDVLVVVSDWRYMNELRVVRERLGDGLGWRVVTVRVDTLGVYAANEEEGLSIGEITREHASDYGFVFAPGSAKAVEAEGRYLARTLGL